MQRAINTQLPQEQNTWLPSLAKMAEGNYHEFLVVKHVSGLTILQYM